MTHNYCERILCVWMVVEVTDSKDSQKNCLTINNETGNEVVSAPALIFPGQGSLTSAKLVKS